MRIVTLFLAIASFLCACGETKQSTDQLEESNTTQAVAQGMTYPSISQEKMNLLMDKCTSIDIVFLNTGYSVSTSSAAESRPFLMHVSTTPAEVMPECPMFASMTYLGDGEILQDANLYFSEDASCCYLVFLEENTPVAANYLTPDAIAYFNKLLASISVQSK